MEHKVLPRHLSTSGGDERTMFAKTADHKPPTAEKTRGQFIATPQTLTGSATVPPRTTWLSLAIWMTYSPRKSVLLPFLTHHDQILALASHWGGINASSAGFAVFMIGQQAVRIFLP